MTNSKHPLRTRRLSSHRGVTLVEVAFSMGIILIGLVGLISIVPIAGRQAKDAVSLNNATALATAGFAEFQARNYLQSGRWVLKSDFDVPAATPPISSNPREPLSSGRPRSTVFLNTLAQFTPAFSPLITADAVCIDPQFVAHRPGYSPAGSGGPYARFQSLGTNGHRRLRFPYYKGTYNPLVNPSEPVTGSNQWPFVPRMTRVTINRGQSMAGQFVSEMEANLLSETGDDLNVAQPDDKSLEPFLESDNVTGTGVGYGQTQTTGDYSWLATVNSEPGSDYASVSVAVIENRDRSFFTYPNDGTVAETPESNATDERLGYVDFAGGFRGGSGGTVEVVMSAFVDPTVIPGQWVMMSRSFPRPSPLPPVQTHRWFRVTGVSNVTDGKPERVVYPDPVHGTDRDVWRLRLMLDGPDWNFGFLTPGFADATVADNTFITFVRNVVSVTEKTVRKP